jgi:nucleoid-associated protein YgaU
LSAEKKIPQIPEKKPRGDNCHVRHQETRSDSGPRISSRRTGLQILDNYARFIGSTLDHVIASALRFVFWKDLDLKRWQKEQRKTSQPAQSTELKTPYIIANPIR